jgi:hypothetical protein
METYLKVNHEELAKEFHILNGGHWHENTDLENVNEEIVVNNRNYRLSYNIKNSNPTYSTAESVLEVMMKRADKWDFLRSISLSVLCPVICWIIERFITLYVLGEDKLLVTAVNWCREHPV